MAIKTEYMQSRPYTTKDGSEIRELIHPDLIDPDLGGKPGLSLAEAAVAAGTQTALHRHHRTEEIYYLVEGEGVMTWGEEVFPVKKGDAILIPPGTPHRIENTGKNTLRILCCCAPAYRHEDTEILAQG